MPTEPTVDFGAHLYPESVAPEPLLERFSGTPVRERLTSPEALVEFYDAAGVDRAVLSQPLFMSSDDADGTATGNDALLEIVEDYDRFYGLAAIPTAAGGDEAAAEFERCLDNGYHGGAIETYVHRDEADREDLEPVYEVAAEAGVPLMVHPKLFDSLHPDVLDEKYYLNRTFGREVALMADMFVTIHRGVLDRYPDLDLVYHHLGGNVAGMMGRARLQLDLDRWSGGGSVKPLAAFEEPFGKIHVDTSGFFGAENPLSAALSEFGSSNVVFGSDYPFEPRAPEELADFVESVETVADDGVDAVCSSNVLDLVEG